MISTIVIASGNPDKIVEIKDIFSQSGLRFKTLSDFKELPEIIEDGNTLEENALKKARGIYDILGIPTIADDTGLEVDALQGAPGVRSARYAGNDVSYQENLEKLLKEMMEVPDTKRTARFRTIAVFYNGNQPIVSQGSVEGRITTEARGTSGFGYDPVFESLETKQTFGEMTSKAKNAISHRGRAFRNLYFELQQQKIVH